MREVEDAPSSDGVRVERHESVALVVLDWRSRRNAFGPRDAPLLSAAIAEAGALDVAAVVLWGSTAFCAGGNLPEIASMAAGERSAVRDGIYGPVQGVFRALRRCPVPTIAAVDGPAIGLGMDLALACDMRFVSQQGWFQQGWARAGLIAGTGGIAFLEHWAPGLMWRLLAQRDRMTADDAVAWNLAEPADGSALDAAFVRAHELATIPRAALRGYARLGRSWWPDDEYFAECAEVQVDLLQSTHFADLARARAAI